MTRAVSTRDNSHLSGRADWAADTMTAAAAAEAAATAAGVVIRGLDQMSELQAVCELFQQVWKFQGTRAPVSPELLRAMAKSGSYVAGAFEGDELVGACVGFFSPPAQLSLHSHIAGVSSRTRGRSVGFALKVHQRAWAMERAITEIAWTYDPLVGRNAYFNLVKLGARPVEYLANFYGAMEDGINGHDDTDRLLVCWQLDDPAVAAACAGTRALVDLAAERVAGAEPLLDVSSSGEPLRLKSEARTVLVAVPRDIEGLRTTDPAAAARWRVAVRDSLGELLAAGARIRGFDRSDFYIVDRGDLT